MQLRQILTGSCNKNDQCLSVGSIDTYTFIAYGSGNNLVILNQDFVRQQVIPGKNNNNSLIISVSCTSITGKILILYSNIVCIYEPNCKISDESISGLNKYTWAMYSTIVIEKKNFHDICWIPSFSDKIILVGKFLQVWHHNKKKPKFYVTNENNMEAQWNCIWNKLNPENSNIDVIKFSSDGKYFATLSFVSKDILIWFWNPCNKSVSLNDGNFGGNDLFEYIIIKHPASIVSFEWRKINSFFPKNTINNSLLTCTSDNVCRIWSESHLNKYHKVSHSIDNDSQNIRNDADVSDHVKKIFLNYINEKELSNFEHQHQSMNLLSEENHTNLVNDPSFEYTYPEFILSANINDNTNLPLFTSLNAGQFNDCNPPYTIHWLNNKDFQFYYQLERGLNYFTENINPKRLDESSIEMRLDFMEKLTQFNRYFLNVLNKWKKSSDVLFSIHPQNGSLLAWFVHNLDSSSGHGFDNCFVIDKSIYLKNAQISCHSCLPNCFPVADAMSMKSNILLYCEEISCKMDDEFVYDINCNDFSFTCDVKMISQQQNGSINLWNMAISNEENGNSSFLNIKHISRISGHRWQTSSAACHIKLPLLLTISNFSRKKLSELILWRIKPIGPFSRSNGITEIARINGDQDENFSKVAWFPGMIPTRLFAIDNMSSPASVFVACNDDRGDLRLFITIADARNILEQNPNTRRASTTVASTADILRKPSSQEKRTQLNKFDIISLTSTGEPGCIISATTIENDNRLNHEIDNNPQEMSTTILLHVFPKEMILNNFNFSIDEVSIDKFAGEECNSGTDRQEQNQQHPQPQTLPISRKGEKYCETYFIVRVLTKNTQHGGSENRFLLEMWQINIEGENGIKKKKSLDYRNIDDLIRLKIIDKKVYCNFLELPKSVSIVKAVPAASHLSSASIYPTCLAPYLFSTLCSDGSIRFWKCISNEIDSDRTFDWVEWNMQFQQECLSTIKLNKNAVPLEISCAYSGRVAVAYSENSLEESAVDTDGDVEEKVSQSMTMNIKADIYECESTGGSEWILEDRIIFPNVTIPIRSNGLNNNEECLQNTEFQPSDKFPTSGSNISSVKDIIKIDWVNAEDGTHLLSIAVGTKIMIFTPTCSEQCKYTRFATDNTTSLLMPSKNYNGGSGNSNLHQFSHWMKLNEIQLKTADMLPPIPEHISWAREGHLIVGLNNELHVYDQWNYRINKFGDVGSISEELSQQSDNNQECAIGNEVKKLPPKVNYSLARLRSFDFMKQNNMKKSTSKSSLKKTDSECKDVESSEEILSDASLFERAQIHNAVLPQYHPKQLMEWINFGKIQRVKAILSHLTSCISNDSSTFIGSKSDNYYVEEQKNGQIDENLLEMNQLEIKAIPPLPVYVLLEIDIHVNHKSSRNSNLLVPPNDLSNSQDMVEFSLSQEDSAVNPNGKLSKNLWALSTSINELSKFGPEQARRLSECLTRVQLPGLNALDQIYLLGIAELMCNLKGNGCNEITNGNSGSTRSRTGNKSLTGTQIKDLGDQQISSSSNSMDDCGLRFLLAMQHFSYMTRTLPHNQRSTLMVQGIDTSSIIWGFHSETEEELCSRLDEITGHYMVWVDFRRYGCGWWIRNNVILQRVIEKVAKNTFQKTKNPMDAAIFYLAFGKQKLVAKLFKNCHELAKHDFFNLDFTVPENINRSLKQAFKMRSMRKYEHSIALFLLCNSIIDAILVALNNLNDIQLAIVIARLYDMNNVGKSTSLQSPISPINENNNLGNSGNLFSIIQKHVIVSSDPFIRSMGYWILEDYKKSLDSLLMGEIVPASKTTSSTNSINIVPELINSPDTNVFIFYNFLKKHPIILRQKSVLNKTTTTENSMLNKDSFITPMERRLYFQTAYTYLKIGCPDLALEVLSKLPERIVSKKDITNEIVNNDNMKVSETKFDEWNFDATSDMTPITTEFRIDWGDDDIDGDGEEIMDEKDHKEEDEEADDDQIDPNGTLDIMCLQYKFMICLKLISEELCTLATGIESHGSFLRYHLYTWIEKEVKVLQNMCGHSTHFNERRKTTIGDDRLSKYIGGILIFNDKDEDDKFSIKDKIILRKRWLEMNQSLILSLYSFCTLHSPNIVGLAAIKMELLILIQELQGSNCIQYDTCRNQPQSSINFPFINSFLLPENRLITTPVQQLKTCIFEIIDCLNSFKCPFPFLFHHSNQCNKKSHCNGISENKSKIKLLRNQCQALSACLHQCLSNFTGIQTDEKMFMNNNDKRRSRQSSISVIYTAESDIHLRSKHLSEFDPTTGSSAATAPNSDPMKWPGFTNLFQTIGCKPRKDCASFSHLLAEALVVIYVGILIYALQLNDSNLLYRLTIVEFNKNFWGKVFGGTLRPKPERPIDPPPSTISSANKESGKSVKDSAGSPFHQASPDVSRNRFYSRLSSPIHLRNASGGSGNEEKFISPLYPIMTCLLEKPSPVNAKSNEFFYDSDNCDIDDNRSDDDDMATESECDNSSSYTWNLLRLVILHSVQLEIKNLLKILQIENEGLVMFCPNIFSINCFIRNWKNQCKINLQDFSSIPESYASYFSDCDKTNSLEKVPSKNDNFTIRLINLCQHFGTSENTPFRTENSTSLSMKRLWIHLIKRKDLQPIFIQQFLYLKNNEKERSFDQRQDLSHSEAAIHLESSNTIRCSQPISIIHKDHDTIYSMAINQIDKSLLVACTSKEIIELSINNLINPSKWFDDDYEYLRNTIKEQEKGTTKFSGRSNDFLLISPTYGSFINNSPSQNYPESSNIILKRPIHGIQILRSHPTLPYYLTGNSNGQVGVFEWGVDSAVVKTYSPIQKGKITSLNFDTSGNKFGMGDSEGNFSLFHFSYSENSRAQYFQTRCPHKGVLDFCFLNSSSVVATCGGSTVYGISSVNHLHAMSGGMSTFDNNSVSISIWDVLLPPGRNQVRNLYDSQLSAGVVTMCYASRYELLIVGTRRGEIGLVDVRQNIVQNIFPAHESCITSIKLDPLQHFFASSSIDGQIKIWRLFNQELIETFRNEPVKTSVFSKDNGIKSLSIIDDDKLVSCSADGFIKLRYINPRILCNNSANDLVLI